MEDHFWAQTCPQPQDNKGGDFRVPIRPLDCHIAPVTKAGFDKLRHSIR